MVLFENSLIKQEYDPSTDILIVDAPSLDTYEIPLVQQTLDSIIESLRNYNIKKLLYDPGTIKPTIIPQDILDTFSLFFANIMQTNLEKFARVRTTDQAREIQVHDILDSLQLPYQLKNFNTKAEAMSWLTNTDSFPVMPGDYS